MAQQLEQEGVAAPVRETMLAAKGRHADGEARLVIASVPDAAAVLSEPVSTRAASVPSCATPMTAPPRPRHGS